MGILNKEKYIKIIENFKLNKDNQLYIHHPITKEICLVNIIKINKDTVDVSIPKDSYYYGQPNFTIKKIEIISYI